VKLLRVAQELPTILLLVRRVCSHGANYYIRKPNDFERLKQVIQPTLSSAKQAELLQPTLNDFVLLP
jgi:hypothetical protein